MFGDNISILLKGNHIFGNEYVRIRGNLTWPKTQSLLFDKPNKFLIRGVTSFFIVLNMIKY